MSLKESLMNKILNRSNSYKFYKDYYEKNKDNDNLRSELNKLKKDFDNYKKVNDDHIESANFLLNTLYVDYELNNPTGLLNDIQSLCNELMVFVAHVCKEHEIEWWIDGGNLLGAARHGYFIPWDDDADIAMMRKDYNKFHSVIHDEIKKYGLDDFVSVEYRPRDIDGETIGSFIQIFIRHKVEKMKRPIIAGVDVFPFDFIKEYDSKTIVDDHFNAKINYFRNIKNGLSSDECLEKLYEELNLSMEPTETIIPSVEGSFGKGNQYKLVLFETDRIFPLTTMKYGENDFLAPNDYDYYLKLIYGNYHTLPKSIRTHSRVDKFRDSSDSREVIGNCYRRIKEVNAKFD